ncbi:MAG: damage-inducible protein DinB [Cyclobacteriaceae bacterium]|nr:damage-inducible protein DinB [Cyclobacteriaceae bacterium]
MKNNSSQLISSQQLLEHWQGHRSLTRRIIEAFPDDTLFAYSVGGMRPFAELALEMLAMVSPTMEGVVTRTWPKYATPTAPNSKHDLLAMWDKATIELNELWTQIPEGRFQEDDKAFGMWEGKVYWILFYCIDNEIHHRGQGYVYLRSLGIEPPHFWER